jgi:SAM-dependent methyltransferase
MAHDDQFEFVALVKRHFPGHFREVKVLEVGSLDINGSVRSYFEGCAYIGIDVGDGKGVDDVCQGQMAGFATASFDVVISCECLEHNPFWVETVSNMFRMVKGDGLVIVSCATTGRVEHGTTRTRGIDSPLSIGIGWEHYRNIAAAEFSAAFNLGGWFDHYVLISNWHNSDLYFVGLRTGARHPEAMQRLKSALQARFGVTQSLRSLCTGGAATLFGEKGVSALRAVRRLTSWPLRARRNAG